MIDISILHFSFEMNDIVKRAKLNSTTKICHCSSDFTCPCCHCSFVYHFFQSLDVLEGRRYIYLSIVTQNQQSNGLRSGLWTGKAISVQRQINIVGKQLTEKVQVFVRAMAWGFILLVPVFIVNLSLSFPMMNIGISKMDIAKLLQFLWPMIKINSF